jgi:hypothetical protein
MLFPPKSFLSFEEDEMLQDPTISFLLPSYVEVQALASESWASSLSWVISQGYHLEVNTFIDDEALKDVYDLFLSLGVDH